MIELVEIRRGGAVVVLGSEVVSGTVLSDLRIRWGDAGVDSSRQRRCVPLDLLHCLSQHQGGIE